MLDWLAFAAAHHRSARDEAERSALSLDAGRDEREVLEVAVRDRKILDLLGHDVRRGVGLVDVDERHLAGDGDLFALALAERELHALGLADAKREALGGAGLEARQSCRDLVARGRQRAKDRDAARRARPGSREPRVGARDRDGTPGRGPPEPSTTSTSTMPSATAPTPSSGCSGEGRAIPPPRGPTPGEKRDERDLKSHEASDRKYEHSVSCDRSLPPCTPVKQKKKI
jgi:hypothetical protein